MLEEQRGVFLSCHASAMVVPLGPHLRWQSSHLAPPPSSDMAPGLHLAGLGGASVGQQSISMPLTNRHE
jgi:hypothetical protein